MFSVVTVRFNKETLETNYSYRKKHKFECMYCSPQELSPKISYNSPVFAIEMNNSLNKIEGIGLIKNKPASDRYYKVHIDGNYNRYTYIGNYFLDRETIEKFNPLLLSILDDILFKGKTHSKRGLGLTLIPETVLKLDICQGLDIKKNIRNLFISNFRENLEFENKDINK
jgi:hypothetical protein